MKNLIIFVVGAFIGLVVGGKLGYEYVMLQVTTNTSTIVEKLINEGVGTGSQGLAQQYQGQAQQLLDEQKEKLKAEAKKQATDYITAKINEFFK